MDIGPLGIHSGTRVQSLRKTCTFTGSGRLPVEVTSHLCSFESLTPSFLRRVYGVRGAGVSPAEVDHQVQLPRPATALREKHHTAGKKTI